MPSGTQALKVELTKSTKVGSVHVPWPNARILAEGGLAQVHSLFKHAAYCWLVWIRVEMQGCGVRPFYRAG